jgi:mannose-6-phosphate isomerase-like protein (cupin superfamily)
LSQASLTLPASAGWLTRTLGIRNQVRRRSTTMKKSLTHILAGLKYLPDRTPEMAIGGGAEEAFAEVASIRDGAIYVGHYSGNSEWERHTAGDELVLALAGRTTVILLIEGSEERVQLTENELVVVPAGIWHRFQESTHLKVLTVTPQPTDHSLERPDA